MPTKQFEHDKFVGEWSYSSTNFWLKVQQGDTDDCWAWLGSNSPYGPLYGAKKKYDEIYRPQMTQARRVLFAETQGRWLEEREGVYHTCHNKFCMNPNHLTLERQRRPQHELRKPGPKPRLIPPAKDPNLIPILKNGIQIGEKLREVYPEPVINETISYEAN